MVYVIITSFNGAPCPTPYVLSFLSKSPLHSAIAVKKKIPNKTTNQMYLRNAVKRKKNYSPVHLHNMYTRRHARHMQQKGPGQQQQQNKSFIDGRMMDVVPILFSSPLPDFGRLFSYNCLCYALFLSLSPTFPLLCLIFDAIVANILCDFFPLEKSSRYYVLGKILYSTTTNYYYHYYNKKKKEVRILSRVLIYGLHSLSIYIYILYIQYICLKKKKQNKTLLRHI